MLLPILFLFKTKISDYFKYSIVIRNIFLIDKRKEYVFYSFLLLTLFNCLLPNNFEFVEVLLN